MVQQLKAIIFDLDGVITDTAEFHYLAWKAVSEELGIPFTRDFNEELKGVSRMESLEKILVLGGKQNDFTEREKVLLAERKNNHYCRLIEEITPKDLLPGIGDFLAEVKQRGIKIGLASVSKNAFTVMNHLNLTSEFDTIVDAAAIRNGKPDPEIFLRAADQLGIEPNACIGIEDAEAGVAAIKAAGMFAVGIGKAERLAQADLLYRTTKEMQFEEIYKAFISQK
ncbi:beta-phosphoglucomutase [Bacillus sp. BRMEA1]|uniref:beta-phosphoglucomutase n=1 Tax=Neobacillus endophyticus TaxID=2738405 RepID=UPI001566D63B|nr:beta-phosphoglucomutase [Neobacillus endophyticus]NRD76514.1 beta-phosphoglucomutase [Neobacillus endophyticus]